MISLRPKHGTSYDGTWGVNRWMEEGILDINLPMVYVNYQQPANQDLFAKWVKFATDHRYNRQVVISPAMFMNRIEDSVAQVRVVRGSGVEGKGPDGVCLYLLRTFLTSYFRSNWPRRGFGRLAGLAS